MPVFGTQHVFHEFKRDRSQVHIGLNESVVDGLSGIGFQQLAFELKIADRHDQVLSWQFSREETKKGSRFGCFSETTQKNACSRTAFRGGLLQDSEFLEDHELEPCVAELLSEQLSDFPFWHPLCRIIDNLCRNLRHRHKSLPDLISVHGVHRHYQPHNPLQRSICAPVMIPCAVRMMTLTKISALTADCRQPKPL